MTKNVFAGKWEIAAENGMNKSIARFPDVCMSPPSPPAGPIPIPYPDTSFSNNLKSASTTVKIGGKGAALAQKSYYKEPVLGDEAATRTFGANVISHQITGKTYFQAWCMDVKFEDKNVCRHLDITSSNHGSQPVITPPLPTMETMTMADVQTKLNQGKCPCCDGPLHEWQKDPNNNNQPYAPMTSSDFWQNRIDRMPVATPAQRALRGQRQVAAGKLKQAQRQSREAQAAGRPGCPNVHQNETDGCAIHFDIPEGTVYPDGQTVAQKCDAEFTYEVKAVTRSLWARANRRKVPPGTTLDHITPKQAGGCNSPNNTVPRNYVQGTSCKEVEANQTILEQGTPL